MANEKNNILKLLIEHQEQRPSIRKIAKIRKINYKSAYQALQKLHQEKIIDIIKYGNTSLCQFNLHFNSSVYTIEYSRREDLFKNKNFKVIHDRLSNTPSQFILLLFGSYAKKTQTSHSDIDLLLITNSPQEIESKLNLLPLNIHLTSITYNNFTTMLKSKEFSVVSEAIKKNIILFGIEDYYRLINHA